MLRITTKSIAIPLLKRRIGKIIRYFYHKDENIIIGQSIVAVETTLPEKVEIRLANDNPAFFLEKVAQYFPIELELFKKRLESGLFCFSVIFDKEHLIGYSWFAIQDYYEPFYDFTFILKPGQIYQFDGFVTPEYRRGMYAIHYIKTMQKYFLDQGYKEALAVVNPSNIKNFRFHVYLGFRETGDRLLTRYFFERPYTRVSSYDQSLLERYRAN